MHKRVKVVLLFVILTTICLIQILEINWYLDTSKYVLIDKKFVFANSICNTLVIENITDGKLVQTELLNRQEIIAGGEEMYFDARFNEIGKEEYLKVYKYYYKIYG